MPKKEDYYKIVEQLYKAGATKEHALIALGLSESDYDKLLELDANFYDACQWLGKTEKEQIEKTLLKLSKGFFVEKITEESGLTTLGPNNKTKKEQVYVQPNINAIKFYLTNKHPEEWAEDGSKIEISDEKIIVTRKKAE